MTENDRSMIIIKNKRKMTAIGENARNVITKKKNEKMRATT